MVRALLLHDRQGRTQRQHLHEQVAARHLVTTWKESWDHYRANPENGVKEPFPDKTSFAQDDSDTYLGYTRGVLALALHAGVEEAHAPYALVDNMVKGVKSMKYKWAVAAP